MCAFVVSYVSRFQMFRCVFKEPFFIMLPPLLECNCSFIKLEVTYRSYDGTKSFVFNKAVLLAVEKKVYMTDIYDL